MRGGWPRSPRSHDCHVVHRGRRKQELAQAAVKHQQHPESVIGVGDEVTKGGSSQVCCSHSRGLHLTCY